jgi:hypothetical protein
MSNYDFKLQEDGKIYALIGDNAVEVSNQNEVYKQLFGTATPSKHKSKDGEPYVYSLLCSVDKKLQWYSMNEWVDIEDESIWIQMPEKRVVALVTFPESGEKQSQEETQEQFLETLFDNAQSMHLLEFISKMKEQFKLTRK